MAEMAAAIGEHDDAAHYSTLLAKLKPEWHKAFWSPATASYSTGTQMAQSAVRLGVFLVLFTMTWCIILLSQA